MVSRSWAPRKTSRVTALSFLIDFMQNLAQGKTVRILKVKEVSTQNNIEKFELYECGPVIRTVQDKNDGSFSPISSRHKALHAWKLRNAHVTLQGSHASAVQGRNYLIADREDAPPWRIYRGRGSLENVCVINQFRNFVLVLFNTAGPAIPSAIYAGTRSPLNWSHWLINFVLTVSLLDSLPREYKDYPLLVPNSIPKDSQWLETLNLFARGRRLISLTNSHFIKVKNLIWLESPAYDTPFSENSCASPSLHENSTRLFIQRIVRNAGSSRLPSRRNSRLFVVRASNSRICKNQDEAMKVAESFGFRPVYFEKLTLQEKINILHDAKFLIGPDGSGFANVIFCQPGTRVFTWWPTEPKITDNYNANLAHVAGVEYRMLHALCINVDLKTLSHQVDLDMFRKEIELLVSSAA